MAVHVKKLCKEGGSPSPPVKKKMAAHVKEGGSSSPLITKKIAVHVKDLCKEGGSD